MVRVSGPLVNVTTSSASVRDVQVHTKKVRAWGDGLMTPDPSQATLKNGVVEFEAAPGPVVMVLFLAEAGAETVSLVVGEGTSQSLADAYRDGQMAGDRDAAELAGILEQIRASVGASAEARAGAEAAAEDAAGSAASAGRDADRAETAAGEAATEAAGLAADAVRLEVKGDADRSAAGAATAAEKAAEAAGSATRAEEAEAGAVTARTGAEAGQELSEDAAAVAVAAAVGVAEEFRLLLEEQARLIPRDADWNTITTQGRWKKPSSSYGGTNIPPTPSTNAPGELIVFNPGNRTNFVGQLFFGYAVGAANVISNGLWYRSSTTANLFSPWERIDNGAAVTALAGRVTAIENSSSPTDPPSAGEVPAHSADGAWEQNQALMTDFIHSMGGPIDTGGKAVVSFRFDHGMKNFAEIVLPRTRAAGIKVAQTMNARNWGRSENDGYTAADLDAWVAAGEVEVWNHGASHIETDDPATQYDEIVNGLHELEAQLPAAAGKIWGFMPPGTGSTYFTFRNGADAGQWASYPGRLILRHHAVATGYMPGTQLRVLDGNPRNALAHYTLDRQTVDFAKARIDAAVEQRAGVNFMIHPNLIDYSADYMTSGMFHEIMDYVVARRDAGDLLILSPYEMMVADSTRSPSVAPEEYDSGVRDITSLVPGVVSGKLYVSRIGSTVWLDFDQLVAEDPAGTYHSWAGVLPAGFRVARNYQYMPLSAPTTVNTAGPLRLDTAGRLVIYNAKPAKRMDGLVSFPTRDAEPVTKPGTPA